MPVRSVKQQNPRDEILRSDAFARASEDYSAAMKNRVPWLMASSMVALWYPHAFRIRRVVEAGQAMLMAGTRRGPVAWHDNDRGVLEEIIDGLR